MHFLTNAFTLGCTSGGRKPIIPPFNTPCFLLLLLLLLITRVQDVPFVSALAGQSMNLRHLPSLGPHRATCSSHGRLWGAQVIISQ